MAGRTENTKICRIQPIYADGAVIDIILHCSYDVVFDSTSVSTDDWPGFSVWDSMNEGQKNQFRGLYAHFIEQMTERIGPE